MALGRFKVVSHSPNADEQKPKGYPNNVSHIEAKNTWENPKLHKMFNISRWNILWYNQHETQDRSKSQAQRKAVSQAEYMAREDANNLTKWTYDLQKCFTN